MNADSVAKKLDHEIYKYYIENGKMPTELKMTYDEYNILCVNLRDIIHYEVNPHFHEYRGIQVIIEDLI